MVLYSVFPVCAAASDPRGGKPAVVTQRLHASEPPLPQEGGGEEAAATSRRVHQTLPLRPRTQPTQVS